MRRTEKYGAVTKDEAQGSPSALLRAMSLSNGRWTFYEAVKCDCSSPNRYGYTKGKRPFLTTTDIFLREFISPDLASRAIFISLRLIA
jgi:hypothetical protein